MPIFDAQGRPMPISVADAVSALASGTLPPGLLYIAVRSPLGAAYIDPGAVQQDPTTQAIMDRLGLSVSIGYGAAPAPAPEEGALTTRLGAALWLGLGALAFVLRPRLTTVLGVGLAWFALGRPGLPAAPSAEAGRA